MENIEPTSTINEGAFRVTEDGEECTYVWKVESPSALLRMFYSGSYRHTVLRNGEMVLEVEVPHGGV